MSVRVVIVLVLVLAGCSAGGSPDTTSAPAATPSPTLTPRPGPDDGVRPQGFVTTTVTVVAEPDAKPCALCVWLADDAASRRRGLSGVTELAPAVGMAFVFPEPRTTAFTMRDTLLPLSIAFYGPDGNYLDAFDMDPCTDEPCPSYPTPDDVAVAVEVPQGELAELGLVPGSRLEVVGGDCDTPRSH